MIDCSDDRGHAPEAPEPPERKRPSPRAIKDEIKVSFEFFPPQTPEMEVSLWRAMERLAPLRPDFVSVTYGAGGSTRERTHATVKRIMSETELTPAAHLTCVQATRAEVDEVIRRYRAIGVRHIVALRGDPPGGAKIYEPYPGGYRNALDLVKGIGRIGAFDICVAAYPEVHPDAVNAATDLEFLKRKLDAGANRAITQFFFDPEVYFRFLDRARAAGISAPIVPGILPVTNFATVRRFAGVCGASVPSWLGKLFEGLDDDPKTRQLVAASVAAEQCRRLQEQGVREFHFYTLNRAELTRSICHILGVRAAPAGASRVASRGLSA